MVVLVPAVLVLAVRWVGVWTWSAFANIGCAGNRHRVA
jgi:hypothetical protein